MRTILTTTPPSSTKATSMESASRTCAPTERLDHECAVDSVAPAQPRRRPDPSLATSAEAKTRASLTNHATPPGWHAGAASKPYAHYVPRPRRRLSPFARWRSLAHIGCVLRRLQCLRSGQRRSTRESHVAGSILGTRVRTCRGPTVDHERRSLCRRPAHPRRRAVRRRSDRPLRAIQVAHGVVTAIDAEARGDARRRRRAHRGRPRRSSRSARGSTRRSRALAGDRPRPLRRRTRRGRRRRDRGGRPPTPPTPWSSTSTCSRRRRLRVDAAGDAVLYDAVGGNVVVDSTSMGVPA